MAAGTGSTCLPVSRRKPDELGRAQWAPYHEGEVCPAVPVVVLSDGDGEVLALVFSASCHPSMIYSLDISADYPGVAVAALNDRFHTEGAMFLQGAGGDTKPRQIAVREERWRPATWEEVEAAGLEVADAVSACVEAGLTPVAPELRIAQRSLHFPFAALPLRADLERYAHNPQERESRRLWAEEMLRLLNRTRTLPAGVDLGLHAVQVGKGLRLIGIEAELVGELGNLVLAEYDRGVTFALGYTDATRIYLPSNRMLPEGGYEVDSYWEYHRPGPLAPVVDEVLRAGLRDLRDSGEIPNEDCAPRA